MRELLDEDVEQWRPGERAALDLELLGEQVRLSAWLYYIIIMALLHFRLAVEIGK
jgi:hypothetical protein